jgi:hypothetical protein
MWQVGEEEKYLPSSGNETGSKEVVLCGEGEGGWKVAIWKN